MTKKGQPAKGPAKGQPAKGPTKGQPAKQIQPGVKKKKARPRVPITVYVAALVAVVLLVVLAQLANSRKSGPASAEMIEVETVPVQTKYHLKDAEEPHDPYLSDPPAGGPHLGSLVSAGFHEEPIIPELLVHNLEDGNVVIYYRPGLTEDVMNDLRGLAKRYSAKGRGIVVVPREDEESAVILTAWRKILRLKSWDAAQAQAFIDRFIGIDHHPNP